MRIGDLKKEQRKKDEGRQTRRRRLVECLRYKRRDGVDLVVFFPRSYPFENLKL